MSQCGRFYHEVTSNFCQHFQFNQINALSLWGSLVIPISIGVFNSIGLGAQGFQIFILLLVFNYGKKDASLMNQPMQLAQYFLTSIENLKKRKQPNQPAVNENLVLLLGPMMISGCTIGLHSKDYIPTFFTIVITLISLLILMMTTYKKTKQVRYLESLATKEQLKEFEDDFINVGDGILINVEQFFQQIQSSLQRESFIKILPQEMLEMNLTIDEHKIKAKDFLNQNKEIREQIHKKLVTRSIPKLKVFFYALTILINVGLLFKTTEMHVCDVDAFKNFMIQVWHRNQLQVTCNVSLFFFLALITKTFDIILLIQLFVSSYIFGFLLGSVGAAAQIVVIILLTKLKRVEVSTAEVTMTLPIIMFSVTLSSTIISLATGMIHDVCGVIAIFLLSIIGQKVVKPKGGQQYVKPSVCIASWTLFFRLSCQQSLWLLSFLRNQGKGLSELFIPRAVCK
ncbi:unnamed protein product (macronuclear) [Paramecium tetraurelia]|uniref:Uncharacterized protein n=1 Tax=Paramecium tetraurelia TaxID=5888 RepID=A0C345_PARTE|nr:uncharacterized protein GSPATT00034690001 [Paramecium tetraurelia]CAK65212.1 unnamed protein product [Paramecium tetraurelia]|eukprot:XP_001432609.1 hypothetical protein (macronuclear) [Paramecium tetraurelia strain d4-2]